MAAVKIKLIHNLEAIEYQHPFDTAGMNALEKLPGSKAFVEKFNELGLERYLLTKCKGNNIYLSNEFFPTSSGMVAQVAKIINCHQIPELYCTRNINLNGTTIGVLKPVTVLSSFALDLFRDDPKHLVFLIGKELGHIKSSHIRYLQIATGLPLIAQFLEKPTLGISHLISKPLEYALLHWQRMATFTSDRAGLLACQDIETAISVFMMSAGLPRQYFKKVSVKSFIKQAKDFEKMDYEGYSKYIKLFATLENKDPWAVVRASELLQWYESGEYHKILERKIGNHFCKVCGNKVGITNQFCGKCGNQLI
jgi:Zn-dependent protease with chaperone function